MSEQKILVEVNFHNEPPGIAMVERTDFYLIGSEGQWHINLSPAQVQLVRFGLRLVDDTVVTRDGAELEGALDRDFSIDMSGRSISRNEIASLVLVGGAECMEGIPYYEFMSPASIDLPVNADVKWGIRYGIINIPPDRELNSVAIEPAA